MAVRPAAELISEREHVTTILAAYELWQLGAKLSESDGSAWPWRQLAAELGLTVEQIDAAVSAHPDNRGFGVMKIWSERKNSTIGVLRKSLTDLKRQDLVEMLDKARSSKLSSAFTRITSAMGLCIRLGLCVCFWSVSKLQKLLLQLKFLKDCTSVILVLKCPSNVTDVPTAIETDRQRPITIPGR